MDSLGPAIDAAVALPDVEPEVLAGLERARAALSFIGKRLAGSDPSIAFTRPLDAIASSISHAQESIDAFTASPDLAKIVNANEHMDAALAESLNVPVPSTPEELGSLVQAAVAFRRDIEIHFSKIKERESEHNRSAGELKATLTDLDNAVQKERGQLSTIVADHQRQFSEGQEKRIQEFATTLLTTQQELSRITSEHQSQFSAGQDHRSSEFVTVSNQQNSSFKEMIESFRTTLSEHNVTFTKDEAELRKASAQKTEELHQQFADKALNILSAIEADKVRVEKLVGVIGNLGVTSGYLRTANHARYTMWMWQAITIAAMISLSIMAYKTLYLLGETTGPFNWGGFAGRVVFLASLGVIAAYAGTQADKLFISERRNRRLALELEAIGPYLSPLPEAEQNKFRIQIGERSFGQEDLISGSGEKSPATLLALLGSKEGKQVLELLADFIKRAKA
jgi:hypothetical protein